MNPLTGWHEYDGERWVNFDLITRIEPNHQRQTVSLWASGIPEVSDDHKLYPLLFPDRVKTQE